MASVAVVVDNKTVFRETLGIAGSIVNVHESWAASKTLVIIRPETVFTNWMTPSTIFSAFNLKQTNRVTITNAPSIIVSQLSYVHPRLTSAALCLFRP